VGSHDQEPGRLDGLKVQAIFQLDDELGCIDGRGRGCRIGDGGWCTDGSEGRIGLGCT